MNTPKFRYIEDILYIDKETYDRDVMKVKDYKDKEIGRLHSIIKGAREYIEKNKRNLFLDVSEDFLDHDELVDRRIGKELLEILDKVEEK